MIKRTYKFEGCDCGPTCSKRSSVKVSVLFSTNSLHCIVISSLE